MRKILILTSLLVASISAGPANAGHRRSAPTGDYVIAESRFGNGTVTGAVRNTDLGPQVQLPGGTWQYCRRSCSETLRVETVDLNENHAEVLGRGGLHNECGIFGCLDLGVRWRR